MKAIKDLFPDIDTCKRFQEMGLFKSSIFVWSRVYGDIRPVIRKDLPRLEEDNWLYCCPTTDEILEVLPKSLTGFYFLRMLINSIGQFICFYANDCDDLTVNHKIQYDTYNNSPVQALAELLLKLKSANL